MKLTLKAASTIATLISLALLSTTVNSELLAKKECSVSAEKIANGKRFVITPNSFAVEKHNQAPMQSYSFSYDSAAELYSITAALDTPKTVNRGYAKGQSLFDCNLPIWNMPATIDNDYAYDSDGVKFGKIIWLER